MSFANLSQSEFIERAKAVHGNKYDYSIVLYKSYLDKISIICPEHGQFEQVAAGHLRGNNCSKCVAGRRLLTTDKFIVKAKAVHGPSVYDYSQSIYCKSNKNLINICPEHGKFEKTPNAHLSGIGCRLCHNEQKKASTEQFVAKASLVHGHGLYDYSRVKYLDSKNPIEIICLTHGSFFQKPSAHTSGKHGCPGCGQEAKAKHRRLGWLAQAKGKLCSLYFLRFFNNCEQFYKVGITYSSVKKRYRSPCQRAGYDYEVLAVHTSNYAARIYDWEQSILETFARLQYKPKRRFAGETECFSSADEILAIFPL